MSSNDPSPNHLHHPVSISSSPPEPSSAIIDPNNNNELNNNNLNLNNELNNNNLNLNNLNNNNPRLRLLISNNQNQVDQDVQAALHFSRARAGTLDLPVHHQHRNTHPDQLWSACDLLSAPPQSSDQVTHPNSTFILNDRHPSSENLHNQFNAISPSLSEHSYDSSHGAFIDHRPTHIHPSPLSRSNQPPTSSSSEHPPHSSGPNPSNRNQSVPPSQPSPSFNPPCKLIDDSLPPSISSQASNEHHPFLQNLNLQRPQDSSHLIRDRLVLLAQEQAALRNPTQSPSRKLSVPACQAADPTSPRNFNQSDHDSCAPTSPRPSQVEQDVCFPALEADRPMSKEQQTLRPGDSTIHTTGLHERHYPRGAAGMLPHFPFPFNFQALEEFAQTERETLNVMRNRRILHDPYRTLSHNPNLPDRISSRTATRVNETEDIVPFTDEEENLAEDDFSAVKNAAAMRRRKIGFATTPSVDKTDESSDRRNVSINIGTSLGGRMGGILNQRRLSENVRPISSAQRKLALFEGAGSNLLNGFSFGSNEAGSGISGPAGSKISTTNLESRTPLLGSRFNRTHLAGGGGGSGGNSNRNDQVRWMNNNERPYRFSFYSNALPSTIHAKSLAEIPGEGQSFEDLFVGRAGTGAGQTRRSQPDPHAFSQPIPATQDLRNHPILRSPDDLIHLPASTLPHPQPNNLDSARLFSDGHLASMAEPLVASPPSLAPTQHPHQYQQPSHHQQYQQQQQQQQHPQQQPQQQPRRQQQQHVDQMQDHPQPSQDSHQQQQHESGSSKNLKPRSGVLMRTDEDAEANTWWLDVLSPTDQEMKLLSKVFGIHPLTTEDILMEETREKIELFRNYYLVCFRSFDQDPYSPTYLEPLNIYIIVFREGTLSFHFRAAAHPQNVRRRIKQLKDYINVTSDWISYALIDDITDAFGPLIQSIEYEVDSIDELVLILKDVEQSDMLRRIGTCRKKVMGLLRLMGNKADVVKGLAKRCNENWLVAPKSDIGLYLSDIQDHLVTMTQNLNHYEKILSRSHSNYLAQISIEMTDANNQINDVLSKLTALGSILVPMNLVTGLWGMNVHVPGQDVTEGYAWFIAIVCGLVSFGIIGAWLTIRYFKFSNR